MSELHLALTVLIPRALLGALFFFQGYDKIFNIGPGEVMNTVKTDYERLHLPDWMIALFVYLTSFTELAGGALLFLGLFSNYALYALGADLLVVSIGFSMIRPMWDMQYVFPRLVLLLFLLLLPEGWDLYSLDHVLGIGR